MGFEELTHTIALLLSFFYMMIACSWIGRVVLSVGWEIWVDVAGISMLAGICMIAAYHWKPTESYGSSKIDHDGRKIIRIFVAMFMLIFVLMPLGNISFSPTPLADLLLLTLMSYVWFVYVAILVISVVFYERINGMIKEGV